MKGKRGNWGRWKKYLELRGEGRQGLYGSGQGKGINLFCASLFQYTTAFINRGASGKEIVYKKNSLFKKDPFIFNPEGPLDILEPLFHIQSSLGWGEPRPSKIMDIKREIKIFLDSLGQ